MGSVSRREFAGHISGAVAGAVTVSLTATASAVQPMPQPPEKPAATSEPAEPMLSYEDHQIAILKELYPAPHLTPEMFDGIREGLKHNRGLAERIRKVPLTHDVPPAFEFVVRPSV